MQNILESALYYAGIGLSVIPVPQGEKGPILKNWPELASTDSEQIKKWWARWPGSNVAIVTGKQGLLVIDADVKEELGIDGRRTLRLWENENGKLPDPTWLCITGRGGYHYYYKVDGDFPGKTDIMEGVDIRAFHNCVLAPPSVHPNGRNYEWEIWPEDVELAEANDALYKLLGLTKGKAETGSEDGDITKATKRFELPKEIREGARNDTLFKAACSMRAHGESESMICESIKAINAIKCKPPLDDREVETILRSALSYRDGNSSYKKTPGGLLVPEQLVLERPKIILRSSDEKKKTEPTSEKATGPGPHILLVSDVEEKEAEWLIPQYIPRNQITILAGAGGTGKTTVWCSLAAAISTGEMTFMEKEQDIPEEWGRREPGRVLFFSSEDSAEYVLKRRLRESGANMRNIGYVDVRDEAFSEIKFNSDTLKALIQEFKPELLIFDPIQSFVPSNIRMGERNAMRQSLTPLIGFGEEFGVTSIVVVHANKTAGTWGRKRIADSADIWDIARSVLMTGETNEHGIFYLTHEKCNYGATGQTMLYSLEDELLNFKGLSDKKDYDFIKEVDYSNRPSPAKDEAEEFILNYLADGEKTVSEVKEAAIASGISEKTFRGANKALRNEKKIFSHVSSYGKSRGTRFTLSLIE